MNNNPFWRLMSYLFNYKKEVTFAILFNILAAIFTVLSAPLISPFLDILFLDSFSKYNKVKLKIISYNLFM